MGLSTKQVSGSTRLDLPPSVQQQQPPQKAEALECPRCESTNTKFCYYNNYNKSQPRHFCKGCKRHWTAGGTLRNVPVGGSRKNKRLKTPSHAAAEADHKNAPSIFFPTIIQNDTVFNNNEGATFEMGPTSMVSHDDQETKILPFSFSSSLGYFDPPISCSIPSFNTQSSSNNNAYSDIIGEFDNVEESTITTVMPFISHQPPWQDQDQAIMNISNATDMANYWSLSDIDSLISADLNIPWDDLEIKPKGK